MKVMVAATEAVKPPEATKHRKAAPELVVAGIMYIWLSCTATQRIELRWLTGKNANVELETTEPSLVLLIPAIVLHAASVLSVGLGVNAVDTLPAPAPPRRTRSNVNAVSVAFGLATAPMTISQYLCFCGVAPAVVLTQVLAVVEVVPWLPGTT